MGTSCAGGLPGALDIDARCCLAILNAWAKQVHAKTHRAVPRFRSYPARWDGSAALFRVHCLVSILQLDFGVRADVSTRHLIYVETGRSVPSRELVLHLAELLEVPLRERNGLLLAAGYAPVFSARWAPRAASS